MTILSKLTATAAAIALAGAVMAPLAAADNRSEKRAERGNTNQRVAQRAERVNANRGERRAERTNTNRSDRSDRSDRNPRSDRNNNNSQNNSNRGQTRNVRAEDRVNRGERQLYANNSVRGQHDRPAARNTNNQNRNTNRQQANRVENRNIRNTSYNRGYRQANQNNRNYNRNQRVNQRYSNNRRYSYNAPRVVYNYRNFYHTPRYSYISYNHYNNYRHYTPRYQIGGFYGYHNNSVIISDYGYYGLYDPPYGHHWVRDHDSGDAILASVATGAIVGLIVGILAN